MSIKPPTRCKNNACLPRVVTANDIFHQRWAAILGTKAPQFRMPCSLVNDHRHTPWTSPSCVANQMISSIQDWKQSWIPTRTIGSYSCQSSTHDQATLSPYQPGFKPMFTWVKRAQPISIPWLKLSWVTRTWLRLRLLVVTAPFFLGLVTGKARCLGQFAARSLPVQW